MLIIKLSTYFEANRLGWTHPTRAVGAFTREDRYACSARSAAVWSRRSQTLQGGIRLPLRLFRAGAEQNQSPADLSVLFSAKPEEIRPWAMKAYELVTKALNDASEARKETINVVKAAKEEAAEAQKILASSRETLICKATTEREALVKKATTEREALVKEATTEREDLLAQLARQELEGLRRENRIKAQNFELLATSGSAYARGVLETVEHQARRTIEGLAGITNRQTIWSTILSSPSYADLADCLWRDCRWSSETRGKGQGLNAAKQIESLCAYLCSNVHFVNITGVPVSATSGILIPKGVGVLEGTYSNALICLLDSFPLDWTMVDRDLKAVDSSRKRRELASAVESVDSLGSGAKKEGM